ncbi:MBL fold metallo-hydrolase [Saccharibacillus sp. JS10]|uniref:MBL fold metallo-hydrolase n=1 Tax=Saccharibacillus sp. JS10 TaxID=2950552 RepID=UPI00210C5614|nr:MBL fold metallo-hydrolase [Saccharibacillus sp. JS10]MCQ4086606.1 MBL fold metallo-hydrolase [Saccharibacillus sp. JS10]
MNITLIRNATLWLEYGGLTWLVDPALSAQGINPPISNSPNPQPNPLVPLPLPSEHWSSPDAVLVTHLHLDHWDPAGQQTLRSGRLGGHVPLFCQPGDEEKIDQSGFSNLTAIDAPVIHEGVTIIRTSGRHGTGKIGQAMGQVSGFVLKADGEPTLYIAGDTIWCDDVIQVLDKEHPDITVVNAGGARFNEGDPIIMTPSDVVNVCRYAPNTQVIAVHMEAINHCLTRRVDLAEALNKENLSAQVHIPADGETLSF